MGSKPTQKDTSRSDSNVRTRSAYEISLTQEPRMFGHLQSVLNPKAGDICPHCQAGTIDYDKLLNLSCPDCGYTLAGCST